LDDSEEWPHKLIEHMNAYGSRDPVWAGNGGVTATNTVNHAVMQWLPGVLQVVMVIFLVGVNDRDASLAFGEAPTQASLERGAAFQGEPLAALVLATACFLVRVRWNVWIAASVAAANYVGGFMRSDSAGLISFVRAVVRAEAASERDKSASDVSKS